MKHLVVLRTRVLWFAFPSIRSRRVPKVYVSVPEKGASAVSVRSLDARRSGMGVGGGGGRQRLCRTPNELHHRSSADTQPLRRACTHTYTCNCPQCTHTYTKTQVLVSRVHAHVYEHTRTTAPSRVHAHVYVYVHTLTVPPRGHARPHYPVLITSTRLVCSIDLSCAHQHTNIHMYLMKYLCAALHPIITLEYSTSYVVSTYRAYECEHTHIHNVPYEYICCRRIAHPIVIKCSDICSVCKARQGDKH